MEDKTMNPKFNQKERGNEIADYNVVDRCLIIKLQQELDHHCANLIREKSDYMIDKRHIKNIIFDFSDASFMDSSGIGVIMGRYKRVIFTGGSVAVSNVNTTVDRIFRLSGLYKIIKNYPSTEEALKELRVL